MSLSSSRTPCASISKKTAGDGPLRSGWQMKVSIAPSLVVLFRVFSIIAVPPRSPSLRCIAKSSGAANVSLFLEPPSIVPSVDRARSDVSPADLRVRREGAPRGDSAARDRRTERGSRLGRRLLWRCCGFAGRIDGLWQLYRLLWISGFLGPPKAGAVGWALGGSHHGGCLHCFEGSVAASPRVLLRRPRALLTVLVVI